MHPRRVWLIWLHLPASSVASAWDQTIDQSICYRPGFEELILSLTICPSSHSGWVKGDDACQDLGSKKLCSYTKASFNGGFGVSLITTHKHFEELSSSSALTETQAKNSSRNASSSYHEQEINGKGRGLVATRHIAAGELVLAQTPAVLVDDEGFTDLAEASLTRLLVQAIGSLPQTHQSEYLKLSTHDNVQGHDERIYQIFAKNNYRTRIANMTDFHATFVDVSRLNHDCRPNCGYHFDSSTLTQKVYAARDIRPGEELTVAYTDPIQTREIRQAHLLTNWGFTCTCTQCTGNEDHVKKSDERVQRIRSLWKELDDYTSASTATPDQAEELVSLYETERLKTRLHEAYYRAAIEYNGVGASATAARYAMLSIAWGQMMAGLDRPFVQKMKELVDDPARHWSWKFRPHEGKEG